MGKEGGTRTEKSQTKVDVVLNQHLTNFYYNIAHTICQTPGKISMISLNPPNSPWRCKISSHFTDEETPKRWQRQDLNQACLPQTLGSSPDPSG